MTKEIKYKRIITPNGAVIEYPEQFQESTNVEPVLVESDHDILVRIENILNALLNLNKVVF